MLFLLPLSLVGGGIAQLGGTWITAMQTGIQFMFRPLLYFQGIFNVSAALNAVSWCMDVFVAWLYFLGAKFIFSMFRGHTPELNAKTGTKNKK